MKKTILICSFCCFLMSVLAQGPDVTGIVQDVTCFGGTDGAIEAIVSNGTPPYTFTWSNGASTTEILNLSVGTYFLTVTDANAMTGSASFVVTEPPELILIVNGTSSIACAGENSAIADANVFGGTPGYTYLWSEGTTDATLTNIGAGTYSVTVTDTEGCMVMGSTSIVEPAPIQYSLLAVTCESAAGNDGSLALDVSGGTPPYTFFWSDGFNTSNPLRTGLSYGNYSVMITDDNGCTENLSDLSLCHADMILPSNVDFCRYDSAALTAFAPGALAYDWLPATGLSCDDCPNPLAKPTETTTYTLDITAPNGTIFNHFLTITVDQSCIWPGDMDSSGVVSHLDLLPIGLTYGNMGPMRSGASGTWSGQATSEWPASIPGTTINQKHVDANGDGLIDDLDIPVLEQNWTEGLGFVNDNPFSDVLIIDSLPIFVAVDTFLEGETLSLPVILGTTDFPADGVYGLAFSIEYDTSIFELGSALVSFSESWLGIPGVDLIEIQRDFVSPGRMDVAMIRTDGENRNGIGAIAHFIITVEDDILLTGGGDQVGKNMANNLTSLDDSQEVPFVISNVRMINKAGQVLPARTSSATGVLTEISTGVNTVPLDQHFSVFPNPVSERVYLQASGLELKEVRLYNALGQLVQQEKLARVSTWDADLSDLPIGCYWLQVSTNLGLWRHPIIVTK